MSAQEKQSYRSKIGQILWTSRQSRPDVVFDACQLASKIKDGKVEHLMEANKVIRRTKSEQVDLKFYNLGSGQLSLLVYTAISLGNLPDGGTQGGYIIFLANEKGKAIPICWNSRRFVEWSGARWQVKPWQRLNESMWQSSCQHCSQN